MELKLILLIYYLGYTIFVDKIFWYQYKITYNKFSESLKGVIIMNKNHKKRILKATCIITNWVIIFNSVSVYLWLSILVAIVLTVIELADE